MTQRKLTAEELESVMDARHHLRRVVTFGGHSVYSGVVLSSLDEMALHGTTDGKPRKEPEPEIGEGYRVATAEDAGRRDVEFWSLSSGGWVRREMLVGRPLVSHYRYRVPVDRIPTDEDAKARPTVMVRVSDPQEWLPRSLLAVYPNHQSPFLIASPSGWTSCRQARFPYPGELP